MQHTQLVSGDLLFLCDVLAGRKTVMQLKKRGAGRVRRLMKRDDLHPAIRTEIEMLRAFVCGADGGNSYFVVAAEYRMDDCAGVNHLKLEGDALLYHSVTGTLLVVESKKMWNRVGWEDEERLVRACGQATACARRLKSWFRHLAEMDPGRMSPLTSLPTECCVLTWEREEELVLSKIGTITKGFVPETYRMGDGVVYVKRKIDRERCQCPEQEPLPVGCQTDDDESESENTESM